MKLLKFNILSAILIFLTVNLYADDRKDYTKEIHKTFSVNNDADVKISNKYGKVNINTWAKNSVEIHVRITVRAGSESKANEVFDKITIQMNGSSSKVTASTEIESKNSKWWNVWGKSNKAGIDYSIDYEVHMPESNSLTLENKYGDAYVSSFRNDTKVFIKYGNLKMDDHDGDLELVLGYSNANIGRTNLLDCDIKYSELKCDGSNKVNMLSKYSEIEMEDCDQLDIESKYDEYIIQRVSHLVNNGKYDDFDIQEIGDLTVVTQYTDYKIGKLESSCDLKFKYGDAIINQIAADFDNIKCEGEHANFKLDIEDNTPFRLVATSDYGDIDYPRSMDVMYDKSGGSRKEIRGFHLNKEAESLVTVILNYGSVRIE